MAVEDHKVVSTATQGAPGGGLGAWGCCEAVAAGRQQRRLYSMGQDTRR